MPQQNLEKNVKKTLKINKRSIKKCERVSFLFGAQQKLRNEKFDNEKM